MAVKYFLKYKYIYLYINLIYIHTLSTTLNVQQKMVNYTICRDNKIQGAT